ncbi:hypothetical protein H4R22_002082 [Coemansia sp. RSA 1290]|nr:hypothetical protein LPJ79_003591 [Coemansia sp. RSA 1821]KAJ2631295.1 hypothetical protein H4R22_002082 [Coemansia sp. RSA 1290]KAJ2646939.1 hypothetical protein IWW40_005053 [Coemansia sp. RSA 1250]KAJ2670981.1 hypothetical protein IWW42_003691 [Coemansia sp. RSA 1085]
MTSSNDTMTAANATSVAETVQMSPSSCTVLIVDKRFLKGVYHTTGSGGSPTMRAGPALDDVVFVQELLEIYGQVVAVVSGDTALRWIFNHTGNKAIIVLIDVDETYELTDDSCDNQHSSNSSDSTLYGPIYTPPASPQKQQADTSGDPDSEFSGPYGLVLLRVIAHYVAIGVFRNVAPIGKHRILQG